MKTFAQIKVPGGKMLQLEKKDDNYVITGDFFCHPEEVIQQMEFFLEYDFTDDVLHQKIQELFDDPNNMIEGFQSEHLMDLYKQLNV